jgi:hypothetical protein
MLKSQTPRRAPEMTQSFNQERFYLEWLATILTVYVQTGCEPETYVNKRTSWIGRAGTPGRWLATQLWLHGQDQHRNSPAFIWLHLATNAGVRVLQRTLTTPVLPPLGPAMIQESLQQRRIILSHLTQAHVHVATAVGWFGCDAHLGAPWRRARLLLSETKRWCGVENPPGRAHLSLDA